MRDPSTVKLSAEQLHDADQTPSGINEDDIRILAFTVEKAVLRLGISAARSLQKGRPRNAQRVTASNFG